MLLEEFFANGQPIIAMEGQLYLKSDHKKTWKRHHFVLRASGLYYFLKEKTKSAKDMVCHAMFDDQDVYKGIGWKKKHKAPTDFTFALKSPKEAAPTSKSSSTAARFVKMLCAEDADTLERWIVAIRVAKYGKRLYDNHRILVDDLSREELEKFSANRCGSIGSIISSVPSQCSAVSSLASSTMNSSISGRLSRASSSSSSGCLSDENNGFDSEFPTGTIKRKPSMKPNLPLTSMTRQLKEVGETTYPGDDSSTPTSPERGGTLTRRHSRRRSEESSNSGTLKRRPATSRGSIESMNSSTPSTPTPTPSAPGTPLGTLQPNNMINNNHNVNNNNHLDHSISPMEIMPSCMTDSTFSLPPPPDDLGNDLSGSTLSLESLPPPPPPCELLSEFSASQASLVSLPPPPPEIRPIYIPPPVRIPSNSDVIHPVTHFIVPSQSIDYSHNTLPNPPTTKEWKINDPQPIYSKTMKPSIKAPPYKAPPPYNNNSSPVVAASHKSVTFADSPVLLRRKVCFEDQVLASPTNSASRRHIISNDSSLYASTAPPPPPRAEATRLSTSLSHTSPKRLAESTSNPPQNFLKDLQRVMRKKWQVAQKCKLEPATTPHEVLGFRDFNGELQLAPSSAHYYRETSNVSNWVQEHYGSGGSGVSAGAEDSLYENLGTDMGLEPIGFAHKKRPPPPPPKRSLSTQLSTQSMQRS